MKSIKFSHKYKKMPSAVEFADTYITDVREVHFDELTPDEIEDDTAIVGGGNYPLPKGRLIWIGLASTMIDHLHNWQTIRRWTPSKFEYYKGLIGKKVKIEIKEA